MSIQEIYTLLSTIEELSTFSIRAKNGATLPYCVIVSGASSNFFADNKTYSKHGGLVVELYTLDKDESLEAKVEKKFNDNDIPFDSDEARDDSQQFYLKYYYIRG